MAERIITMLTELRACMHVLASSPIMVDTGQMVPKYQLRTVSDQQNYVANSLDTAAAFPREGQTLHARVYRPPEPAP